MGSPATLVFARESRQRFTAERRHKTLVKQIWCERNTVIIFRLEQPWIDSAEALKICLFKEGVIWLERWLCWCSYAFAFFIFN